jgi:LuxR family maltose regulon positive regulatory protein
LDTVREFVETTHNTRFLIEVLALQALLNDRQGERQAALNLLDQTVTLAQPGGFIRLFVDLGPSIAGLLAELVPQDHGTQPYIDQILTALKKDEVLLRKGGRMKDESFLPPSSLRLHPLIEPLTNREQDVLELLAQRLSNQEIAERLFVSPSTVKTHNKNIFAKLNAKNRRQAIARAQELGLIDNQK